MWYLGLPVCALQVAPVWPEWGYRHQLWLWCFYIVLRGGLQVGGLPGKLNVRLNVTLYVSIVNVCKYVIYYALQMNNIVIVIINNLTE